MGVIGPNMPRKKEKKMTEKKTDMSHWNNNAVVTHDKQSSIEVSRNAKGLCAFKVKTYYDATEQDAAEVTKLNLDIMNDLIAKFE